MFNEHQPFFHCFHVPSFKAYSSKLRHVTEKHVLIGCKHYMLGNQTFEQINGLYDIFHMFH